MMLAACEVMHPFGAVTIPSRGQVEHLVERFNRDEEIWLRFDGRNYDELAAACRLAPRQVRRIIERYRQATRSADA